MVSTPSWAVTAMFFSGSKPGNSARTTYFPSLMDSSIRTGFCSANGHGFSSQAATRGNTLLGVGTNELITAPLVATPIAHPDNPHRPPRDTATLPRTQRTKDPPVLPH